MTKGGSVEVKAPSETAAVDIVAREQDSPAGRRNKKIENTDFDIVARNSLRHHKKKKRMKFFKEFFTAFHTGPVIPKNGVLVDPPYRDRIHTTVCWNTPLPEPAIPVRYYRKCPVSSSYRPVIPSGNTGR